jgi:hypothetical protein
MRVVVTAVVILGTMLEPARAAPTAREVLDRRSRLYATRYAWRDQHQVVRVTTRGRGRSEQVRVLEIYERRYPSGDRRSLLLLKAPDMVRGTAVLSQLHGDLRQRWLYLPKLRHARRLGDAVRDESVLGSELTYRDLDLMQEMLTWTARDVRAAACADELLGDTPTHALRLTPRADAGEYARIDLWVGTDDLVMRQLELRGTDAAVIKRITQADIRMVGTVPIAGRVAVANLRTGATSTFDLLEVAYDVGFDDERLSLAHLDAQGR